MATVFIGIGSNLGDRQSFLDESIVRIGCYAGEITGRSSVIETEPWGFESATPFLNMAVRIETDLSPADLLSQLLDIETGMGRIRRGKGYESRVIDLDILFYDDLVINNKDLVIPHPLLHKRLFVLKPLAELTPDLVHPVLNRSISELLNDLVGSRWE